LAEKGIHVKKRPKNPIERINIETLISIAKIIVCLLQQKKVLIFKNAHRFSAYVSDSFRVFLFTITFRHWTTLQTCSDLRA